MFPRENHGPRKGFRYTHRVVATGRVPTTPDVKSAGVADQAVGAGALASINGRARRPARTIRAHDGDEPQAGGVESLVDVGRTYGHLAAYLIAAGCYCQLTVYETK